MLRRVLSLLIAFPIAAILVTLAVANRHAVRLVRTPSVRTIRCCR